MKSANVVFKSKSPIVVTSSVFLQYLRCNCLNLLQPPVFICHKGHSICMECREKYSNCSVCKATYIDGRNRILETLLEHMNFPCEYKLNNCKFDGNISTIVQHIAQCQYKNVSCPLDDRELPKINLISHLRTVHRTKILENLDEIQYSLDESNNINNNSWRKVYFFDNTTIITISINARSGGEKTFIINKTCLNNDDEIKIKARIQSMESTVYGDEFNIVGLLPLQYTFLNDYLKRFVKDDYKLMFKINLQLIRV